MKINLLVDEYSMDLEVPDDYLASSHESFQRLDANMDRGVQMGREWIRHPDQHQRCQFAASKLLTSLESDNHGLALLSAGYIVDRIPGITQIRIDTSGEMSGTTFS
jgi:hypothetical protein